MSAEAVWVGGLLVGLTLGIPVGFLWSTAVIPSLVDAVYDRVRRDRRS